MIMCYAKYNKSHHYRIIPTHFRIKTTDAPKLVGLRNGTSLVTVAGSEIERACGLNVAWGGTWVSVWITCFKDLWTSSCQKILFVQHFSYNVCNSKRFSTWKRKNVWNMLTREKKKTFQHFRWYLFYCSFPRTLWSGDGLGNSIWCFESVIHIFIFTYRCVFIFSFWFFWTVSWSKFLIVIDRISVN